jgi:signal transduction histidine kinase
MIPTTNVNAEAGAPQYLDRAALEAIALAEPERAVLEEVNARVAAHDSTERILDFLYDHTLGICPGDRLSVALLEDEGERLVSHYTVASYSPLRLDRGYAEELRGSSLEPLVSSGSLRVINDLTRYLEGKPGSRATRVLVAEGVRSSLSCPLLVEGRVVGVLFRSSREAGAYSPRHAALHQAIAERLAQAVEKTHRIEQLRATNLAYTELLGFVAHELKSPVASMVSTAQVLADGYAGPVTERQRELLGRVAKKGQFLLGLVHDYLELARLEGGRLPYAPRPGVDLEREVVSAAVEMVRADADARGMSVEVELPAELGSIEADAALLRLVLVNLLSNAVKYGRDGGRLRVRGRRDSGGVEVTVWNEGVGFTAAERALLFRKFSRLQNPELLRRKGTGVGLYTVRRLVAKHGGRVLARSEPGEWAELGCWLPQPPATGDPRSDEEAPQPS